MSSPRQPPESNGDLPRGNVRVHHQPPPRPLAEGSRSAAAAALPPPSPPPAPVLVYGVPLVEQTGPGGERLSLPGGAVLEPCDGGGAALGRPEVEFVRGAEGVADLL